MHGCAFITVLAKRVLPVSSCTRSPGTEIKFMWRRVVHVIKSRPHCKLLEEAVRFRCN